MFPTYHNLVFLVEGDVCTATVLGMQPLKKGKSTNYCPILEIHTPSGVIRRKSVSFYDSVIFRGGEKVRIVHNSDFSDVRIFTIIGFWFRDTALLLIVLVLLISAVYGFLPAQFRVQIRIGKKKADGL